MSQSESFLKQWKKVRYWSQDESRMGLHTIQRRKLTGYGIKPQGKVQWDFTYLWLYGAVEALSGASFFYEFTHLDTGSALKERIKMIKPNSKKSRHLEL